MNTTFDVDPLPVLRAEASAADAENRWPALSWQALRQAGVLRGCIPTAYGGQAWDALRLLDAYEELASGCLTTCFILSQREAACRRIRDLGQEELCSRLLPGLASGELFATVGLSHLTTSRQYGPPAVRVVDQGDSYRLRGSIPWVTGAPEADYLVTGGMLDDGRQILGVVPCKQRSVQVGQPLDLMALQGSLTAEIHLDDVCLDPSSVLASPAGKSTEKGKPDAGGLETSCLAIGLARAAVEHLIHEAKRRPDLQPTADQHAQALEALRGRMHELAVEGTAAEDVAQLRARANALVLQATQAALAASKGAGFRRSHPAQRWARQALFFLVWSCPRPAMDATLAFLTPSECDVGRP